MAGAAASGARHASAHLFHGAAWVLCDDIAGQTDIDAVGEIVQTLGAHPVILGAEEHDRRVSLVSHLPRLLASALIELAQERPGALDLSAGSFRDLTRMAGSDPEWWTEVLTSNKDAMLATIESLESVLRRWKEDISGWDAANVTRHLAETRTARAGLGASSESVRVLLFDRPGEIALVGRALEKSRVDLRALHIRHAEYGGGGVLTLSVGTEEAGALRSALVALGFEIED